MKLVNLSKRARLAIALAAFAICLLAIFFYRFMVPPRLNGIWSASGQAGGGISWELSYAFEKNNYTINGYPSLHEQGEYQIIKKEEVGKQTIFTLHMIPDDINQKEPYNLVVSQQEDQSLRIGDRVDVYKKIK